MKTKEFFFLTPILLAQATGRAHAPLNKTERLEEQPLGELKNSEQGKSAFLQIQMVNEESPKSQGNIPLGGIHIGRRLKSSEEHKTEKYLSTNKSP